MRPLFAHIHLGVKDDDLGKVCGVKLESEWITLPNPAKGTCSVPFGEDGGRPCPICFGKDGQTQGEVEEKPQHCQCTRYESALPNKFMLLQPQSWHPDVWTDITRMLSLNSAQSAAGREMNLCPMQFDLADRAIAQFSMKGETVFDPFGGLGTVPLRAIKMGRKGLSCELSPSYFRDACFYCEAMERKMATPSLFDLLESAEEEKSAIGWLIEAYCGLVKCRWWDRPPDSKPRQYRYMHTIRKNSLRVGSGIEAAMDAAKTAVNRRAWRLVDPSPAPTTPAPPLPESRPR